MSRLSIYLILFSPIFFIWQNVYTQNLSAPTDLDAISSNPDEAVAINAQAKKYLFSNPDSALALFHILLQDAEYSNDSNAKMKAHHGLAEAYYMQGAFYESLTHSDSAMSISILFNDISGMAKSINNKGLIYLGQDRLRDAIAEFEKALHLNVQLKDTRAMAVNYFNIGLCLGDLKLFDSAFYALQVAQKLAQEGKDVHLELMSLNRMAETYFSSAHYQEALQYYQAALQFKPYQDNWEKCFAYSGLAQTLFQLKQYQQALDYAEESFIIAQDLKAKWDMERAANILSKCYAALGDYKQGYAYLYIANSYKDSLVNEKKDNNINYLHLQDKKGENDELLEQNAIHQQAIKINQAVILIALFFLITLVGLLFLLQRSIQQKKTLNQQLQASNEELLRRERELKRQAEMLSTTNKVKDRILSVIGHDLRSPFASILQATELIQAGIMNEEDQKSIFEHFNRRVLSVSELVNNLLLWASGLQEGESMKWESIDLTEIVEKVFTLYQPAALQKEQVLKHRYEGKMMITGNPLHIHIILQNLISNAIKFTSAKGSIEVFYTIQGDHIATHIKDDGRGMSPPKLGQLFKTSGRIISENGTGNEGGTGLGLFLVQQFIEENNGRIEVHSREGAGSEFIIYFRIS